jgi:hypothetical protein
MLALMLIWQTPMFRTPSGDNGDMLARDMQEAEQFMTDIALLVENALPPVYLDISGESSPGWDEEFIQFMVPSVEDEPLTYNSPKRGVSLC